MSASPKVIAAAPLVLMTPRSLLRHPLCVSDADDFTTGSSFHRVLWDDAETKGRGAEVKLKADKDIRRVVMCSGKVYYDLFEEREKRRAQLGADPAWQAYITKIRPFISFQETRIMKPAPFFEEQRSAFDRSREQKAWVALDRRMHPKLYAGANKEDAEAYANWQMDYLKEDSCGGTTHGTVWEQYARMRDALNATGRHPNIAGLGLDEFRLVGVVGPAAGDVHHQTRDPQLLLALGVEVEPAAGGVALDHELGAAAGHAFVEQSHDG